MKLDLNSIIGSKKNKLTILKFRRGERSVLYCKCKCDCGNEKEIVYYNFTSGATVSCGCQRRKNAIDNAPGAIDITGQKFGRLTVIKRVENNKHGFAMWHCKCDCGNDSFVYGVHLRNGSVISCGCYKNEMNAKKKTPPFHGIYNRLLDAAKRTNRECNISYEDYLKFIEINKCHYCSQPIIWTPYRPKHNPKCEYYFMGYNLDRKDNAIGYTLDNCVVCCPVCNHIKGKMLTYDEMLKIGPMIGEIRKARTLLPPSSRK